MDTRRVSVLPMSTTLRRRATRSLLPSFCANGLPNTSRRHSGRPNGKMTAQEFQSPPTLLHPLPMSHSMQSPLRPGILLLHLIFCLMPMSLRYQSSCQTRGGLCLMSSGRCCRPLTLHYRTRILSCGPPWMRMMTSRRRHFRRPLPQLVAVGPSLRCGIMPSNRQCWGRWSSRRARRFPTIGSRHCISSAQQHEPHPTANRQG
jgi:hypothetical protein